MVELVGLLCLGAAWAAPTARVGLVAPLVTAGRVRGEGNEEDRTMDLSLGGSVGGLRGTVGLGRWGVGADFSATRAGVLWTLADSTVRFVPLGERRFRLARSTDLVARVRGGVERTAWSVGYRSNTWQVGAGAGLCWSVLPAAEVEVGAHVDRGWTRRRVSEVALPPSHDVSGLIELVVSLRLPTPPPGEGT